jgi:nicotinamide-nucleotide amidase
MTSENSQTLSLKKFSAYIDEVGAKVVTAESCTAGLIASMLGGMEGCGGWLEGGLMTYSPGAKCGLLGVNQYTIDRFGLTSEQVAQEMAIGALHVSQATFAIANTGLAGPHGKDGIPAGTVCFAWAIAGPSGPLCHCETQHFAGNREAVREAAAAYAIEWAIHQHAKLARLL